VEYVVEKVTLGQVFFFTCQYHYIDDSYLCLCSCCCYQKDKRAKPVNLPNIEGIGQTNNFIF
jgi:hypothetical protein